MKHPSFMHMRQYGGGSGCDGPGVPLLNDFRSPGNNQLPLFLRDSRPCSLLDVVICYILAFLDCSGACAVP